jgi:predicted nucleic acid-binding protein
LNQKEQVKITLTDIDGRLIKEITNEALNEGEHSIAISTAELAAGMYFIMIDDNTGRSVRKLSVKH